MSQHFFAIINRRPLHSSPTEATAIAQGYFEADDPHSATSSVVEALDALGISKADSEILTEFSHIVRIDGSPTRQPDWTNETVKVWVECSYNPLWPFSVTCRFVPPVSDKDAAAVVSIASELKDIEEDSNKIKLMVDFDSPLEANVLLVRGDIADRVSIHKRDGRWIIDGATYNCHLCPMAFWTLEQLAKHFRRRHPMRLNDVAEAFVLLHETELGLRRVIEQNLGPEGVSAALERNRKKGVHGRPLMFLADCKFHDYIDLVTSRSNWHAFEKSFPIATRELINRELLLVNNIRNGVGHFRRQITRADTIVLKRFRDRLKRE
jgi:hypothetical protein